MGGAFTTAPDRQGGRARLFLQIGMPVTLVTMGILLMIAFGLDRAAEKSDALSVDRQVRSAQQAVVNSIDALPVAQLPFAIWDDMVDKARRPVDTDWLRSNAGSSFTYQFPGAETFILDPQDRFLYGFGRFRNLPESEYLKIERDIAHLVAAVRGRGKLIDISHSMLHGTSRPPKPTASVGRIEHIVVAAHLAQVDGRAAAVSIMHIVPNTWSVAWKRGDEPLFITVRYLNKAFLVDMEKSNLLSRPSLVSRPNAAEDEATMTLRGANHETVAYLHWRPELPGTRLSRDLAPFAIAAAMITVCTMAFLAFRLTNAIAAVQAKEADARHRALHDPLTSLPNRVLFGARLDEALGKAGEDKPSALLLLDLDRFKQVNDTMGHAAGDGVLREFARRMAELTGPEDTIARFGGDEFGMIMRNIGPDAIGALCDQIIAAAQRPIGLTEGTANIGVSIGVAMLTSDQQQRSEAMRAADRALYLAKASGRGTFTIFRSDPARDAPLNDPQIARLPLKVS